jgi:nucleoporin NUP159
MNVTRLQQPPLQSNPSRSVSHAEDITPDVRRLVVTFSLCTYSSQFLSIRLVNKRTRVRLSQEPLDLTSFPNKGQLFVVASTLGWFVAIVRSSTGFGMFIT